MINIRQSTISPKFAFTAVYRKKDMQNIDYMLLFHEWQKKGCKILCKYAETNKRGFLHYHGIIEIPTRVYRKGLIDQTLFSIRFKKIFNEDGWVAYCMKDQDEESLDTDDNGLMARLKKPLF